MKTVGLGLRQCNSADTTKDKTSKYVKLINALHHYGVSKSVKWLVSGLVCQEGDLWRCYASEI